MKSISTLTDGARYSGILDSLIKKLGGKRVLRLDFESDYQGHVDIDIELKDGRVFSYYYPYGSCSGCDDWEDGDLSDEQIEKEMKEEATIFKDIATYLKWRAKVANKSK